MITKKHYSLILKAFTYIGIAILASCNGGSKLTPSEDFGAYYTKINSGEDEVVSLAKSWMHAPKINNLKGESNFLLNWRKLSFKDIEKIMNFRKRRLKRLKERKGIRESLVCGIVLPVKHTVKLEKIRNEIYNKNRLDNWNNKHSLTRKL